MKIILFLLLTFSAPAQNVTKKVLAQGNIFSWQITQMSDNGTTAIYFTFTSQISKNSNGMQLGIMTAEETKCLVTELRNFANYPNGNYNVIYDSFSLKLTIDTTQIILIDVRKKNDGNYGYLKLSRTSAKSLASEIEKSITLMN